MEERREMKTIYRLVPCPQYDLSGMEHWLSDMAQSGWILQKEGITFGVAGFEQCAPKKVRYRLLPAEGSTSMWADNGGEPGDEVIELNKEFGWEYVAKRGEFYIYRTEDMNARELHTDSEIQALAMNAMRKRQRDNIVSAVLTTVLYPWLAVRGKIFLTMIVAGTVPVLLLLLAVLGIGIFSVARAVKLMKLKKCILRGEEPGTGSDWKKGRTRYWVESVLRKALYLIVLVLVIKIGIVMPNSAEYCPITDYTGEVPFRTMETFLSGGRMEYMDMNIGHQNTVREWTDLLAAENYEYDESGTVYYPDGTILSGGLDVTYHETKADWIAKRLVKEYVRKGKKDKDYQLIEVKVAGTDEVVAYSSLGIFRTVIMRKGNKVMCARFYTAGADSIRLDDSEWAGFLAESLN